MAWIIIRELANLIVELLTTISKLFYHFSHQTKHGLDLMNQPKKPDVNSSLVRSKCVKQCHYSPDPNNPMPEITLPFPDQVYPAYRIRFIYYFLRILWKAMKYLTQKRAWESWSNPLNLLDVDPYFQHWCRCLFSTFKILLLFLSLISRTSPIL